MQKIQPKAAAFKFEDAAESDTRLPFWKRVGIALELPGFKPKRGDGKFPYRDGIFRKFCKYLLSAKFRLACQLVGACTFSFLFVFVKELQFIESCIASILVLASFVLLSPHPHVGCYLLNASILLFFATYLGPYTGAIASLAYSTGAGHYTGSLVAFGIVGFIPFAYMRGAPGNPGPGMIGAIVYGVLLIFTIPRLPKINLLWRLEIAHMMASLSVSVASVLIATIFIFPTLAGQHLQSNIAKSLRGMGHSLSGYSSFLVGVDEHEERQRQANSSDPKSAEKKGALDQTYTDVLLAQMTVPELNCSAADFYHALNKRTDPHAPRIQYNLTRHLPNIHRTALRGLLDECKLLMMETTFEPAWLQKGRLVLPEWGKVLADSRTLLTRLGAMAILVESGQLIHGSLLERVFGFNPMPTVGVVMAELAAAIQSLSTAISYAGTPKASQYLTAVPWSEIRQDLITTVAACQEGYWKRHSAAQTPTENPETLEARVLLFLVTLIHGIVSSVASLEQSIPVALGLPANQPSRWGLGTTSAQRLSPLHNSAPAKPIDATSNGIAKDNSGVAVTSSSGGDQNENVRQSVQSPGHVALEIETAPEVKPANNLTLKQQFLFLKPIVEMWVGISLYRRFKPIMWDGTIKALSSWKEFRAALGRRRVQYGLKFWFGPAVVFSIIIAVQNDRKNTRSWKLYYGFITTIILSVEKVEAAAWKTVQRIMGTLMGATLAYLIMLRVYIHSRGVVVAVLVLTSAFVFAQRLHTNLKYTCFLSILTLYSLTLCQYAGCCKHHEDFHNWLERTVNIIVACLFATGVCWFVFPWYASDDQLLHLAEAYNNTPAIIDSIWTAFGDSCKNLAEGNEPAAEETLRKSLETDLESKVVVHLEAVLLSLKMDQVLWHRGFFATPRIVFRLVDEIRDLLHHVTAFELSVNTAPEEFGRYSPAIYHHFFLAMDAETRELLGHVKAVTQACFPILKHGPKAELKQAVEEPLGKMGKCRSTLRAHLEQLRREDYDNHKFGGKSLTAADLLRLGSFLVAVSRVMDKIMLIARIVIDDSYKERETMISNLTAMESMGRNLSIDH